MRKLLNLKNLIFEMDNKACFIERDRILGQLEIEMAGYDQPDKYALILSELLSQVSVPIHEDDYFAGRVVEALPPQGLKPANNLLWAHGHMSPDYKRLLSCGLKGILSEIKETAEQKGDAESASFARNAEIVVNAIREYCLRYAAEAEKMGYAEMAEALKKVPYEPAYDYYSALQGIWIIHMIASCYVGGRDYAFGIFDEYMLPFYEKALAEGKTEEELTKLLAGFFIKANEICGRTAHNHDCKPVLSHSSNQYVMLGGEKPNAFSTVCLKAAAMVNMPQPSMVVRLKPDADPAFTQQVFQALEVLKDSMNIYNYDLIVKSLMDRGIPEDVAKDFTYSACCTFDLNYHTPRCEYYIPTVHIFTDVLYNGSFTSLKELLEAYSRKVTDNINANVKENKYFFSRSIESMRQCQVLDGLLMTDTAKMCKYGYDSERPYCLGNMFLPGVATVGDSLMVLDKLVFKEKRYSYEEFKEILKSDYAGKEALRREILNYGRFGNDMECDKYTIMAGNTLVDAVDRVEARENEYYMPGFYSLERDNSWSSQIEATPDGRKKGSPFSENQSPTYGADKNGITALLNSVSKLPFDRTAGGGLNLTFSGKVSATILEALTVSYFRQGGLHVGISVIDRDILCDAMHNPEKYKSLTVRLYGFSEYFVSLPPWQQVAVLNRTEYAQS